MTKASPGPSFDDLDALMRRSPGAPRFTQQRLEPVVLPPPPTHVDPAPAPVSAADDIEPNHEAEFRRRRAARLVLTLAGCAAVAAVAGYLAWPRIPALPPLAPPVPIEAAPAPVTLPPVVLPPVVTAPPEPESQPAPIVSPALPADARFEALRNADQNELTPPVTDGLTPPRRVPTRRIRVENDREVSP